VNRHERLNGRSLFHVTAAGKCASEHPLNQGTAMRREAAGMQSGSHTTATWQMNLYAKVLTRDPQVRTKRATSGIAAKKMAAIPVTARTVDHFFAMGRHINWAPVTRGSANSNFLRRHVP